jgi:hypothetical protein
VPRRLTTQLAQLPLQRAVLLPEPGHLRPQPGNHRIPIGQPTLQDPDHLPLGMAHAAQLQRGQAIKPRTGHPWSKSPNNPVIPHVATRERPPSNVPTPELNVYANDPPLST